VMRRFALRRAGKCRYDHSILAETVPVCGTVGDMLDAIGEEPAQLEVRRGLGRFLSVESLKAQREKPLAEMGFVNGDRVRVKRPSKGGIWLSVEGC